MIIIPQIVATPTGKMQSATARPNARRAGGFSDGGFRSARQPRATSGAFSLSIVAFLLRSSARPFAPCFFSSTGISVLVWRALDMSSSPLEETRLTAEGALLMVVYRGEIIDGRLKHPVWAGHSYETRTTNNLPILDIPDDRLRVHFVPGARS
jgi:hypothetical protein